MRIAYSQTGRSTILPSKATVAPLAESMAISTRAAQARCAASGMKAVDTAWS